MCAYLNLKGQRQSAIRSRGTGSRSRRNLTLSVESLESIIALDAGWPAPATGPSTMQFAAATKRSVPIPADPQAWHWLATALEVRLNFIVSNTEVATIGGYRTSTIRKLESALRNAGVPPDPPFAGFLASEIRPNPSQQSVLLTGVLSVGKDSAHNQPVPLKIFVTAGQPPQLYVWPKGTSSGVLIGLT